MTYVLDTNIVTALLKGDDKVKKRIKSAVVYGDKVLLNGISYYEIKRGLLAADAITQLKRFDSFCQQFGVLLLDDLRFFDRAAEIYADLKKKGQLIEDADILMASATSTHDFVLVSDDTDFGRIKELKIENWLR